jgi:hypothetical protein
MNNCQESPFYFENLSLKTILSSFFKYKSFRLSLKINTQTYFYLDQSWSGEKIIIPLFKLLGIKLIKIDFQMMKIKDENNELIRYRIVRKDLFEIQQQIIVSDDYKRLKHSSWKQNRISDYINKGLVDEGIMVKKSTSRILYIIHVVNWHMSEQKNTHCNFIVDNRAWFNIFKNYALQYQINLLFVKDLSLKPSFLSNFIKNNSQLYTIIKNIKYWSYSHKKNKSVNLYLEGRGDVNLQNNGHHSDFFWLLNSSFPSKNLLYQYHNKTEKLLLESFDINTTKGAGNLFFPAEKKYTAPQITIQKDLAKESELIQSTLAFYNCNRIFWKNFFETNNTKIYMMWHRFNNYHIAVSDAINDVGGVSVYWPVSLDGYSIIEAVSNTDILFSFSAFGATLEKQMNSKFRYNIITGYPRDYAGSILKVEAQLLRKKLEENGAKKIVFVIDENSIDDNRWHTGHELQRDNYRYILEKVLETPWLGVVFKPKAAKTLKYRLGDVANLLERVEKTGRCFIYRDSTRYTTSAPPVLAGLSADVCIHGHLGTAALECVLEKIPTIMIDREGDPHNKLHELPEGKVVFRNWPDAINATMDYLDSPQEYIGFGDWSSIIDELDPFRDGKAAFRIGSYLHWLIQGFEQGLDKEIVLVEAAEKYKKQWGADKVITL